MLIRTFGPITLTLEGLSLESAAYIVGVEKTFREALAKAVTTAKTSEEITTPASASAYLGAALAWCLDASPGGRPPVRDVLANPEALAAAYTAITTLGAGDADLRELAREVAAWVAAYLVTPLEQAPARAGFFAPKQGA